MKYLYKLNGKEEQITTMEQWRKAFYTGKKSVHWKPGRSAHAMADFMMEKNGEEIIAELVGNAIGDSIELEKAYPEWEVRFDEYGHGREHDLGIWCRTGKGERLFIGVEAKVDETFNDTIGRAYLKAKAKHLSGVRTNGCQRIEELMKIHFGNKISAAHFDLRYQLMYATMGTLLAKDANVKAELSVLLVLVFAKGPLYDPVIGKQNHADYRKFLNACNSTNTFRGKDLEIDELALDGQELICIYHSVR
ncbi:MAG: hypothetical protein H6601_11115 [Flavobacteriales bacterium]|nr:hypothetical protein [Flavobacteriales bacterium]MCB9203875.1 hypothetical protein [Flavobacteriales bacterium]